MKPTQQGDLCATLIACRFALHMQNDAVDLSATEPLRRRPDLASCSPIKVCEPEVCAFFAELQGQQLRSFLPCQLHRFVTAS